MSHRMKPRFQKRASVNHLPPKNEYAIQALQRGMQVLDTLLEARAPLNLEQICECAGLSKSTAFRIVVNLLEGQYLTQVEQGYWLGLKLLRLGALVEDKLDLKSVAQPFLARLRDQVNETVHLAVLDDEWRVVYLDKLSSRQSIGIMMSRVGITTPMYCTGLGKAMVAFHSDDKVGQWLSNHSLERYTDATITDAEQLARELGQVRDRGYSTDNGEHEEHVRCIAAPIRNRRGQVVAALSVAGPDTRMPMPLIGSPLAAQVVKTAQAISDALGYSSRNTIVLP